MMAGVSLPEIQDILGHARPETTMRYRAVSLERKRPALARLLEESAASSASRKCAPHRVGCSEHGHRILPGSLD